MFKLNLSLVLDHAGSERLHRELVHRVKTESQPSRDKKPNSIPDFSDVHIIQSLIDKVLHILVVDGIRQKGSQKQGPEPILFIRGPIQFLLINRSSHIQ